MHRFTAFTALAGATALAGCFATTPAPVADPAPEVELRRLACGTVEVAEANAFNDEDLYPGETLSLVDSCYLIRHGDAWLLWDAGLPSGLAESGPQTEGIFTVAVETPLVDQLAQLGLTPSDIDYLGISHSHFDHLGDAALFPDATLVIQQAELDWVTAEDGNAQAREPLAPWLDGGGDVMALEGDADLFGDGTVETVFLPGHTPGHQALLVRLANAGPVMLSGDEYHFDRNRENRGVPDFNTSRDDTLASHDRLEGLLDATGAKLVIQHEPDDVGDLPAFPAALR